MLSAAAAPHSSRQGIQTGEHRQARDQSAWLLTRRLAQPSTGSPVGITDHILVTSPDCGRTTEDQISAELACPYPVGIALEVGDERQNRRFRKLSTTTTHGLDIPIRDY